MADTQPCAQIDSLLQIQRFYAAGPDQVLATVLLPTEQRCQATGKSLAAGNTRVVHKRTGGVSQHSLAVV